CDSACVVSMLCPLCLFVCLPTHLFISFFFSLHPRPPKSTLFPYTTLFRSVCCRCRIGAFSAAFGSALCESSRRTTSTPSSVPDRSEEHTSELQSPDHLVCRLLLEKKKKKIKRDDRHTIYVYTTASRRVSRT